MTQGEGEGRATALAEVMIQRARALWGEQFAEDQRQQLLQLTQRLVALEGHPPHPEVEPGFHLVKYEGRGV